MAENIKWEKSKFIDMIQEYSDKIADISKDVEDHLAKQLNNYGPVDVFARHIDDKKKVVSAAEIINSSKGAFSLLSDAPIAVPNADENADESNDNTAREEEVTTDENNSPNDDEIEETEKNSNVKESALHYMEEYSGKLQNMGKHVFNNAVDTLIDIITKSPGVTDLDVFRGSLSAFKEPFNRKTAENIYDYYTKNRNFNILYKKVTEVIESKDENLNQLLYRLTNEIKKENNVSTEEETTASKHILSSDAKALMSAEDTDYVTPMQDVNLLFAIYELTTMAMTSNIRNVITSEFKDSMSSRLLENLIAFVNKSIEIKNNVNKNTNITNAEAKTRELTKRITLEAYDRYISKNHDPNDKNSIAILFAGISNAIGQQMARNVFNDYSSGHYRTSSGDNKSKIHPEKYYISAFAKYFGDNEDNYSNNKIVVPSISNQTFAINIESGDKLAVWSTVTDSNKVDFEAYENNWNAAILNAIKTKKEIILKFNEILATKDKEVGLRDFVTIIINYKSLIHNQKVFDDVNNAKDNQ